MSLFLPLTFLLPLAGTLILSLSRGRLGEADSAWVGVSSVGLAAVITALLTWTYLASPGTYEVTLWTWIASTFSPGRSCASKGLSCVGSSCPP